MPLIAPEPVSTTGGSWSGLLQLLALSPVPPERFAAFWHLGRSALAPGGRVLFLDSLYTEASTAVNHRLDGPDAATALRRLNDGREYGDVIRPNRKSRHVLRALRVPAVKGSLVIARGAGCALSLEPARQFFEEESVS